MPLTYSRDKALPDIPVDVDEVRTVAENEVNSPGHSGGNGGSWKMNKILPSIDVEKTLSGEDMDRMHGAALSAVSQIDRLARAHRKKRGHNTTTLRVPAPISIPDPENILSSLPSATASIKTPSTTGTHKRWGFLSARKNSDAGNSEKKVVNALEILRSKAQQRLITKLTKSTPNLSAQVKAAVQGSSTGPPATPEISKAAPTAGGATSPCVPSVPAKPLDHEVLAELEKFDKNAIYFTIDPEWRASQGSVVLKFITPIPSDYGPNGRPDSPLLHRHHSLDQLACAHDDWQPLMSMEFPEECLDNTHPVDELHSFLEF
ncbi:hypothetical protein BU15DRAFT_65900 [Melanogaster broomeanus]|nr:hypothetical protein BU15DRAFT_65900 [Melanogaster broomeanus]